MKKIVYMAPEMEIVELKIQSHLLESSGGDGQGSSPMCEMYQLYFSGAQELNKAPCAPEFIRKAVMR